MFYVKYFNFEVNPLSLYLCNQHLKVYMMVDKLLLRLNIFKCQQFHTRPWDFKSMSKAHQIATFRFWQRCFYSVFFFFPYNYFSFQSNHFNSFNSCTIINYNDGPTIVFLLRIPKTNHACSLMIDSLQVSLQTPKPLLPTENTKQNTGLQRWTNSNSVYR